MEKLTLQQLESTLWKAADILRGGTECSRVQGLYIWIAFFKTHE